MAREEFMWSAFGSRWSPATPRWERAGRADRAEAPRISVVLVSPAEGPAVGLAFEVERIARRAHRADRVARLRGAERLAQPADVHVDGAGLDIDVRAPD